MPSPFPGMDPYLEQEDAWHDFHERFMPLAAEVIGAQVMPAYIAKIDQHVYIRELPADERRLVGRGDVTVAELNTGAARAPGPALMAAPAYGRVPAPVDVERQSFIEIRDRQGRGLVTVVELLSPTNKRPGPDREQYLAKRRQLLASGAHLVEIDLLRGYPRLPLEGLPGCDYYVMVSRAEERPRAGLWPLSLRNPLPTVPIPLRSPDPDASLGLQQLMDRIYDAAGYRYYIYAGAPQPLLRPEDAAWCAPWVTGNS